MERIGVDQASLIMKMQADDDLYRLKKAEKQRKRLKKALAKSAANCSELEKQQQKTIGDQQRLGVEVGAISESVLLGEETHESCLFVPNNNKRSAATEGIGVDRASRIIKKRKKKKKRTKERRLEKALAKSAAIRFELEKKKHKKIEDQQRLDEEVDAIAESVALHVLLDDE